MFAVKNSTKRRPACRMHGRTFKREKPRVFTIGAMTISVSAKLRELGFDGGCVGEAEGL
jgi:hypothetical protein